MKNRPLITLCVVVFAFAKAYTAQAQQDFKAIATYMSQTKMDIKLDSAQQVKMNSDPMLKQVMESMSKPNNEEFQLEFTQNESSYNKVEELAKPKPSSGMSISISASSDVGSMVYKNLTNQEYMKQGNIMGKDFVIEGKLQAYDWELHSETKQIGQYTCFKATYTPPVEKVEVDENEEENKNSTSLLSIKTEEIDRTITAWYTPDIPVSNGPGEFHGLPGLIVELKKDNTIILLTAIELNPDKDLKLKKPKEGKKINQQDFDDLQEKKMKEMMEKHGNGRGNGPVRIMSFGG